MQALANPTLLPVKVLVTAKSLERFNQFVRDGGFHRSECKMIAEADAVHGYIDCILFVLDYIDNHDYIIDYCLSHNIRVIER